MSAIQGFGRCGEKKKPIARKRGRNVVDNDHDKNNDDDKRSSSKVQHTKASWLKLIHFWPFLH